MNVAAKDLKTLRQDDRGKWVCNDFFTVQDIQYTGRKICFVRIKNEKTGCDITFGTPAGAVKEQTETGYKTINTEKANALQMMLMEKNVNVEKLLAQYGVDSIGKLNETQHADIVRRLNK